MNLYISIISEELLLIPICRLKPEIASIGPGKRVLFTDGTEGAYDVICLATGYTIGVPFVKKCVRDDIIVDNNEVRDP